MATSLVAPCVFCPRALMTTGMLFASVAMLGLAQVDADSSYNAIWPFFILLGGGLALTMPSSAAAAMGSVEVDKAGIASGVVNATRQVGGALGIAILGSVVAKIATDDWLDKAQCFAGLPTDGRAPSA